jgi:glutathione S-transferase
VLQILEDQLAKTKWMLGEDFTLVECDYGPVLNVIEKAGFSFEAFPKVRDYLQGIRSRQAWQETPKLPGL